MAVTVPINDLKRHNHGISQDIQNAIDRVLARGWYILGPEVEAFEAEYAEFCGVEHCVGVGNGTDALELGLRAIGVEPGDRVATVANAGMYSTTAIRAVGAEPLFVDVEPQSMNMSADSLAAVLDERPRAVIVTHLYGRMADMPRLVSIASQAGIPVMEDCAQAHGARLEGKPAGSWGNIGCFSFYPTKNLGALGDGGALTTNDPTLAKRARLMRQYGWSSKYRSSLPGGRNSRLDELQAAILRAKLPHLGEWNRRRREVASAYSEAFSELDVAVPARLGADYVAHLYVLRSTRRDDLRALLTEAGIGTDIHYPVPDHRQESVGFAGSPRVSLMETENCSREVLTLPCFPEMTDTEVQRVITAVQKAFDKLGMGQ